VVSSQHSGEFLVMQEFFRRDYPHLIPLLQTENGREILVGVQKQWAELLKTRGAHEEVYDDFPDLIQKFCQEIVSGSLRNMSDEATRIPSGDPVHRYLDNLEKLWREVYEHRMALTYQFAGAWVDWTTGGHTLTENEEITQEVLSEFSRLDKDLAKIVTDYAETANAEAESILEEARATRRFGLITAQARLMTFLSSGIGGVVLGIIPGLLLGMVGWHSISGIVAALIWVFFFTIGRKLAGVGEIDVNYAIISVSGGLGLWLSITLFGSFTS